jgi:hypothetical protein
MISPDRLLLQRQIYNFLRTTTIKYSPIAQYINEGLLRKNYVVDFNNPATWKYYLNMQGKYHESDTLMNVVSLDTRETILFSPDVLVNHPRTRAVYLPGGPYYTRLCDLYPEQVDLIKSVLFPVTDINNALAADDLTLLNYGSGYLEIYEESVLIMDIERFLEIYKERWYFSFLDDEPYFYLTAWSSLHVQLAMLLMSSRVAHIKTSFVHSWDLWNELAAYGLDNYSDVLDREKAMMLYQNIDYLKINAGKQSNLTILADRLLSSFGIAVYGRSVVQESETGEANYQLTPQLVPVRIAGGGGTSSIGIQVKTVSEIQEEIYTKGLTQSDTAEAVQTIERQLGDTTLNNFATKFVEIKPTAQIKPYAQILNVFLLESLIVSITRGYYTNPVEVYDPLTNSPIYLPPAELLALYNYASLASMGLTPSTFPSKVRLYRSFTPDIGSPNLTIPYFDSILYLSQVVDASSYLNGLQYSQHLQNPAEFSDNVTALWLRFMDHQLLDEGTTLDKAHAAYQYLSTLCHTRREESLNLVPNYTTYEDWLGEGGIDLFSTVLAQYSLQPNPLEQWGNLADTILSALIPISDVLASFGNFTLSNSGYNRLRQLFVQLTSYHLVFLESDRDIADFSITAKWSTDYGAVQLDSYSESLGGFGVELTNQISRIHDLSLHNGVTLHRESNTLHQLDYTVSSVAHLTQDQSSSPFIPPKTSFSHKAVSRRNSPLKLVYHAPLPIPVEA